VKVSTRSRRFTDETFKSMFSFTLHFARVCGLLRALVLSSLAMGFIVSHAQTPPPPINEPPVLPDDLPISESEKAAAVDVAAAKLNAYYIRPDLALEMEIKLKSNLQSGAYRKIKSAVDFAARLQQDLWSVQQDDHLRVRFSPGGVPPDFEFDPRNPMLPPPEAVEEDRKFLGKLNYHIDEARVLPGNVGYLRVNGFVDGEYLFDTLKGSFGFLARTDSLILDLRSNVGGAPTGIAHVAGYLLGPTAVHLFDLEFNRFAYTESYSSWTNYTGIPYLNKRVFVLAGPQTFSAGESFTYALQQLERVVVVGEPTGGGAHLASGFRLTSHLGLTIPVAYTRNPISHEDWEGTGVIPDVAVSASAAIYQAQVLAIEQQLANPAEPLLMGEELLLKEALATAKEDLQNALKRARARSSDHSRLGDRDR
jgi:hypothetical protein